jgi:hypothetical protein
MNLYLLFFMEICPKRENKTLSEKFSAEIAIHKIVSWRFSFRESAGDVDAGVVAIFGVEVLAANLYSASLKSSKCDVNRHSVM